MSWAAWARSPPTSLHSLKMLLGTYDNLFCMLLHIDYSELDENKMKLNGPLTGMFPLRRARPIDPYPSIFNWSV
jgi:hypothetical protein